MKEIKLTKEFITLGQLLKIADIIGSGGMAKYFIAENKIFVNNEKETRRGRKLYQNDLINIVGFGEFKIV